MKHKLLAALMLLMTSCSDIEQGPPPVQAGLLTSQLTFLSFRGDAYEAVEKSASFWAVPGETRTLMLRYTDTGRPFATFSVGANSLLTEDSVQISVRLDDSGKMILHFSPAGLQFNPYAPAILRIDHGRKNPDIDGNGYYDLIDVLLGLTATIWKQDLPLLPWLRVPSLNLLDTVEEARVYDFTSFGMAVD